jgi:hypothetical protein
MSYTTRIDAYEEGMAVYLASDSSMPEICDWLRNEVKLNGQGLSGVDADILTENVYHRLSRGDMGRGDVRRAVDAAILDATIERKEDR